MPARARRAATPSGSYTFEYRVTAPHKGAFKVCLTRPGYDPAKPPTWSELDLEHPVATVTDPVASGGFHTISGTLPERSGRQLLYAIWQCSDSPEAFCSCSDVDFGGAGAGSTGSGPAPTASAPSDRQIAAGADKSTTRHHGQGGDETTAPAQQPSGASNAPKAAGTSSDLAEALLLSVRRRAAGGAHRR
ncbi:lytic polysaccharide monooxygenase [Streptomyces sp. NPDC003233]